MGIKKIQFFVIYVNYGFTLNAVTSVIVYSTSTLVLEQPANLSQLFNQFNDVTDNHTNRDPDNVLKCRYYDTDEIQTLDIPNKSKSLSMFHINTCSLSKNFDDLEYLLKTTNMNFDITEIPEIRITKNMNNILSNINLDKFSLQAKN